jgi:hypothetical protein
MFLKEATVEMEDGTMVTVAIPDALLIEIGSVVTEVDTGDGKPVYHWA